MKKLIDRFKTIIHITSLLIIDFLARKTKVATVKKELIIIRVDVIGDYLLFRNFLKVLRYSEKFKDYKITLLGDKSYQNLAETLDNAYVDQFIWIDRRKFCDNYSYRFRTINKLSSKGYEILLNPIYSRDYLLTESLVKIISAVSKVGCEGDDSTISHYNKVKSDKNYTHIFNNKKSILFEFYRNMEFFEQLIGKSSYETKYAINLAEHPTKVSCKKYAILFLGASHKSRQWSAKNFADVGAYLKRQFDFDIVICGSKSDEGLASSFKNFFKGSYIDLVGKTTLIELSAVIQDCQLLVTNETSSAHLAVALGTCPVFVIYNGIHFGRFTPYPLELTTNYYLILHPYIANNLERYKFLSNKRGHMIQLNINDILAEDVIDKIATCFKTS